MSQAWNEPAPTLERLHPDRRFARDERSRLARLEKIIVRLEQRLAMAATQTRNGGAVPDQAGLQSFLRADLSAVRWALDVLTAPDHARSLTELLRADRARRREGRLRDPEGRAVPHGPERPEPQEDEDADGNH